MRTRFAPLSPTPLGWVALCLAAAAFAARAAGRGGGAMDAISALSAGLALSGILGAFRSVAGLRLERDVSEDGERDRPLPMPLTAVNASRWRSDPSVEIVEPAPFAPGGVVRTPLPPIPGKGERGARRVVQATRRGVFKLENAYLVGRDPFGLFKRAKRFHLPAEVTIYPRTERISLEEFLTRRGRRSSDGRPTDAATLGEEFFGIREYRCGDPKHLVDWKHSAKLGKLIVKEFEALGLERFAVVLDTDARGAAADGANFEFLVDAAASLLRHLAGTYSEVVFATAASDGTPKLLSGPSGTVWARAGRILAETNPSDAPLERVLDAASAETLPGTALFCFSMSDGETVSERLADIADAGSEIFWTVAPKSLFGKDAENADYPSGTEGGLEPVVVSRELSAEGVSAAAFS